MRRLLIASSILGLGLLAGPQARSQDTSDLDALLGETVSRTASKSAQASTAVPALTINVTAEDLRRHGIRTLAEAYDFLAVGIVSQDALGDVEVGSRGVLFTNDAGKHLLLMVDGHVTNDQRNGASYHGQAAGIPLELIDHIEIMLGPGSVLYGANATLGVVNVITKRAKDFSGVHLIVEGAISPAENQAHTPIAPGLNGDSLRELGKAYRLSVGMGKTFRLLGAPAEVTGQIEYYDLKGPNLSWPQIYTGNNAGPYTQPGFWGGTTSRSYYQHTPSGYLRLRSGALQLTLHGVAARTSAPNGRLVDGSHNFDDPLSYADRGYTAADLSWSRAISETMSLQLRIYGDASQAFTQGRSANLIACLSSQVNGCIHTSEGHGRWLGTEVQTTIRWLSDLSMSTLLGVEARVRWVDFESGLGDLATGANVASFGHYNETGISLAAYGQQVYSPAAFLTFNAGARADFDNRFGHRVSPRGAVAVDVWHGGTLKAIYSEAFRAPTTEELHLTNRYLVLAAPSLLPEIVRSAEALVQQRIGTHRMALGVFASWWDNVVSRHPLSQDELSAGQRAGDLDSGITRAFQFRNLARVDSYGLNATYEGTASSGRLVYGANVSATYARIRTGGETQMMTVTPAVYGNARVSYDLGGALPLVAVATQLSGRRRADNANDPGVTTPYYAPPQLAVRLTGSGHVPRIHGLTYRLSANYAFTSSNPFAAAVSINDPNVTVLIPVNRLTVLLGLQYDF